MGGKATNSKEPTNAKPAGPTAPKLSVKDILTQFWTDAYGKEVQTAATYSYTWLADQFGHLCIGIVVDFAATAVGGLLMVKLGRAPNFEYDTGIWPGLIFTIAVVAYWEWRAYQSSVKQATGVFPLDSKLLRDNAIIAATYMTLGAILGFAFHLPLKSAILISAGVVIVAICARATLVAPENSLAKGIDTLSVPPGRCSAEYWRRRCQDVAKSH